MLVGLSVVATQAAPTTALAARSPDPAEFRVIRLPMTTAEELPPLSRHALIAEASAIWRDSRIRLEWLNGVAPAAPHSTLRVLIAARTVTSGTDAARWTVGELLRFKSVSPVAIASIAGAERIVAENERFQLIDFPIPRDQRLGVILGRALAHEIGHYLLHTNTHAPDGLMRASIDAQEFADVRFGAFRLDRVAKAHLAALASQGLSSASTVGDRGFSYR